MTLVNNEIFRRALRARIVPVHTVYDRKKTVRAVGALRESGIGCVEITLRSTEGLDAIVDLASSGGELVIGAGTVRSVAEVESVYRAGAQFIVSPGTDFAVLDRAKDLGLLAIPGVATATEVQAAFAAGYRLLKVFPAGTLGGPQLVSSLAEVYPEVQFMPSGGVNATTMQSYLSLGPCIAAVSGTWLTQAAGAAEAAPEVVRQRCDHARSIVEFEASCR